MFRATRKAGVPLETRLEAAHGGDRGAGEADARAEAGTTGQEDFMNAICMLPLLGLDFGPVGEKQG